MNFRVSSLPRASRKTPALVSLVRAQDLVQLGPLLTMVKVERLGELVELFHRLVLEVRGVFVAELFLPFGKRGYLFSEVWKAARASQTRLTERRISRTRRAMKRFSSHVLG